MNRVTEQVKTNTQLFLDELWKKSNHGEEVVSIDIGELDKIDQEYKYGPKAYLVYLQKIGCIDYDYFGNRCLVSVKRKEVVQ
ncbi:hypothetical protein [Lactobacillus phage LL-H]|uniref:hypothetical protein n=1 Tax=Lactococcus phage LL-H TaxID=12348 RepID=UPI000009B8BB|nr:hypothetical protein LPLLH_ORF81 [Lactobacillus phage LL-H]AAL77548.1 hypothetical protein [Lactobacillus phage LL-H]